MCVTRHSLVAMGGAAILLLAVAGAVNERDVPGAEMAAPKYDTGGSYGSSGYSSGSSYGSYGGSGGGYGGGSYGGSGGGGSYGGGGGYGGGGAYSKDTGNVYYYYYPSSSSYGSSYQPPAAYPMYYPMYDEKDKEEGLLGGLLGLGIPAVLVVLFGVPLILLGLLAAGAALAFFIGRSNGALPLGDAVPGGFTDLTLVRAVHEAFAAYQALSTDENCRQRVVCELGYVFKASQNKEKMISFLDAMLPSSLQRHFKPLKEVLMSGESGKCQKYICDAAASALKAGPFKSILGGGGSTTSEAPVPGTNSNVQHSPTSEAPGGGEQQRRR